MLVEQTRSMIEMVDHTVAVVRRTATDLRPGILDELGLAGAIEWQAAEFEKRTNIRCEVSAKLPCRYALRLRAGVLPACSEAR